MKKNLLPIAIFSLSAAAGCAMLKTPLYSNIQPAQHPGRHLTPDKETLETLLYDLLNSGFLEKSPLLQAEILDNRYGIFTEETKPAGCRNCSGAYIKDGEDETIVLIDKLFTSIKKEGDMTIYHAPSPELSPALVHEIFHDFWENNFILPAEKQAFAKEAKMIYHLYHNAKSNEQKLAFLETIGYENPSLEQFKGYDKLKKYIDNPSYPAHDLYGTELYSVFAELAYAKKGIVPKQVRRFYRDVITKECLAKSKP